MYHNKPGEVEGDHSYIAHQPLDLPRIHFRSLLLLSASISKYSDRMHVPYPVSIPSPLSQNKRTLILRN